MSGSPSRARSASRRSELVARSTAASSATVVESPPQSEIVRPGRRASEPQAKAKRARCERGVHGEGSALREERGLDVELDRRGERPARGVLVGRAGPIGERGPRFF